MAPTDNGFGAALSERSALELYYQTRARETVAEAVPGLNFETTVSTRQSVSFGSETAAKDERSTPGREQLTLGVLVRTENELAGRDREAIEAALTDALELDRARGDSLAFSVGPAGPPAWAPSRVPPQVDPVQATIPTFSPTTSYSWLFSRWTFLGLVLLAIFILVIRPRRRLDDEESASFAELLKNATAEREFANAR